MEKTVYDFVRSLFVLQAEDGIRDAQESRGLGDVYKRQVDQYRYLFEDSRAKAVFVSTALLPMVQEAAKDLPNVKEIVVVGGGPASVPRLDTLLAAENEGSAPARTCADEVAYWLYSSGTTGNPKGTMHVHSTPMNIARTSGQGRIGIREDDVIFSAPKLFFAYGLGDAMLCPLSLIH